MINSTSLNYTWKWAANCTDNDFTYHFLKDPEKMVSHLSFDCKSTSPKLKIRLDKVFEKIAKLPLDQEVSRKAICKLFKFVIAFEDNTHYHLNSLLGLYLRCIYEGHDKAGYDKLTRTISTLMISSLDQLAVSASTAKRGGNRKFIRYTQKDDEKLLMMLCEKRVDNTKKDDKLQQISKLIQDGVDVNTQDPLGFSPLHIACFRGYLDLAELLLKNTNINLNAKTLQDETPLIFAAYFGHIDICKALLASHVNLEAIATNGWTVLLAASSKLNLPIVKLLYEAGANPLAKDQDGKDAIQTAMAKLHINIIDCFKIIDFFLSQAVPIDIVTELEFTMRKHVSPSSKMDLILQKDLSQIKPMQRMRLLDLAFEYRHFSAFKALYKSNAVKDLDYLINAKIKLKNVEEELKSASILTKVYLDKKFEFYSLLISFLESLGVNLDQKEKGQSRFLQEFEQDRMEFESIIDLLSIGVDVDSVDDDTKETALMMAVQRECLFLVKLLVENKASLDLVDASGKTALMHAQEWEYNEIETYLIDKGAIIKSFGTKSAIQIFLSATGF